MDSFFKSGLWFIFLLISSLLFFRLVELNFPLLDNKWYFAIGIILGVLFIQEKHKKYEEDEQRNGNY